MSAEVKKEVHLEIAHERNSMTATEIRPAQAACDSLSFLVAARGASAAAGGFGFALNTAATFDFFYWLQVTNYGVLYVLFDSAPSGSNYIDVWDLSLHAQTASPIIS